MFIRSNVDYSMADVTSEGVTADKGEVLEDDVLSLTSSDPAASALLALSPREQEVADEEEEGEPSETSKPPCPAYVELLEVMEHASGRLQQPWDRVKKGTARERLDERFLSVHNPAAPVSLPFLPDLHVEIEKAWKNPYSARIHRHQQASFADVEGMSQHGSFNSTKTAATDHDSKQSRHTNVHGTKQSQHRTRGRILQRTQTTVKSHAIMINQL
ncbi:hypothetical protein DPX16_14405 [Anabarilius grahami]|uniref:Uncharacterized protein n=1 Tax=Anabarilius grahami TaxID=495550 RepID=A0A3N0XM40_ANAGA|nr:hypothetical protein DPX16_14405 [Anabarilius grahami]